MNIRALPQSVFRKSPAKINWWLRVLDRRPDGYHNLETVFQRLSLCDDVVVTAHPLPPNGPVGFCDITGFPPDLPPEHNLIHGAWRALCAHLGPEVVGAFSVQVTKRIPAGGGLGGGSSNAATALQAMIDLRGLKPDPADIHKIASQLGADVPFFLSPHSLALGGGRGTDLSPLPEPAGSVPMILAISPVGMPTSLAYKHLSAVNRPEPAPGQLAGLLDALVQADNARVAQLVTNDFERIQGEDFVQMRGRMEILGANNILLAGSGSTVAILFSEEVAAQDLLTIKDQYPDWDFIPATSCGPPG